MATNIYFSNAGDAPLTLELVTLGPDSAFESNLTSLVPAVPAAQVNLQVLSVTRSPYVGLGAPVTMAELRISCGGQFVGSLVLMLNSDGRPLKNSLDWMLRGPGPAMTAMVSDRDPHSVGFETPSQRIRLTGTGKSSGLFDDIYVEVLVQATDRWVSVTAARDRNLNRVIVLAIDGADRPHLMAAPFGAEPPQFTPLSLPGGGADPPSHHAVIFDNAFDSAQPIWIGGLTETNKLWLLRTDGANRIVLDLQPPANGTLASLVVSDAFTAGGTYSADLFLTTQASNHTYRLYSRVLTLGATPALTGTWTDWGQVKCKKPAYVRAADARYLCAPQPGAIVGVNMNYCFASINASDYGRWRSTSSLPGDGTTNNAIVFSWDPKESPRKEITIGFRGSDGVFYGGTDANNFNWIGGRVTPDGDTLVPVDGTNFVPVLYRDAATGLVGYVRWAVKEFGPAASGILPASSAPACFSGFHYDDGAGTELYALWQGVGATDVTLTAIP